MSVLTWAKLENVLQNGWEVLRMVGNPPNLGNPGKIPDLGNPREIPGNSGISQHFPKISSDFVHYRLRIWTFIFDFQSSNFVAHYKGIPQINHFPSSPSSIMVDFPKIFSDFVDFTLRIWTFIFYFQSSKFVAYSKGIPQINQFPSSIVADISWKFRVLWTLMIWFLLNVQRIKHFETGEPHEQQWGMVLKNVVFYSICQ